MIVAQILKDSHFDPVGRQDHNICRIRINGTGPASEKILPCKPPQSPFDRIFKQLNPVQTAFLALQDGRQLQRVVLATPTSSGKSLIAYMFLSQHRGVKVYAVPRKAIADEKAKELARIFGKDKVEVRSGDFIPEYGSRPPREYLVCTCEHLVLSLRNRTSWLSRIGALAIDEVHVMYNGQTSADEILWWALQVNVPLLCLSATIPELEELAGHVRSDAVILSEWRPVPITKDFKPLFPGKSSFSREGMANAIALRVLELLQEKSPSSMLVFVPSKKVGWLVLSQLALSGLDPINEESPELLVRHPGAPRVAFHCADLSRQERENIETGYRQNQIPVLIATTTLAYGVNFPAEQVVVVVDNRVRLEGLDLWPTIVDCIQMEGRAGRLGMKDQGEVLYLIKNKKTYKQTQRALLSGQLHATLKPEEDQIEFYVLSAVLRNAPLDRIPEESFVFRKENPGIFHGYRDLLEHFGFLRGDQLTERGKFCFRSGLGPSKLVEFSLRVQALNRCGNPPELRPLAVSAIHKKQALEASNTFHDHFKISGSSASYIELVQFLSSVLPQLSDTSPRCLIEPPYRAFLSRLEEMTPLEFRNSVFGEHVVQRRACLDNVLGYVTGTWFILGVSRPLGPYGWLKHDCYYLARMLCQMKQLSHTIPEFSFFRWTWKDILETLHSLAFGLPAPLAWIGGVPGIGHVQGSIIAHALTASGVRYQLGPETTGRELRNLLMAVHLEGPTLQDVARVYARARTKRRSSSDPKRLVASIISALEAHGDNPLVDKNLLSWVFEFVFRKKLPDVKTGLKLLCQVNPPV